MIDSEKMKAERIGKSMSQEALSKAASLSHYTIHRLESGKYLNPRIGTISAIAEALSINVSELIKN